MAFSTAGDVTPVAARRRTMRSRTALVSSPLPLGWSGLTTLATAAMAAPATGRSTDCGPGRAFAAIFLPTGVPDLKSRFEGNVGLLDISSRSTQGVREAERPAAVSAQSRRR